MGRRHALTFALAALIAASPGAAQTVYKLIDRNGKVTYSEEPPKDFDGKVIRIDSLVTKPGDWLFNANAYLKYTAAENWQPLMKYQGTPPAEMIRGANAYLDAFADKFTDIPWGQPCARLEGGAYTNRESKPDASCEVGIPPGTLYIVNRDYLVDPEMGVINVFCRFGGSTGGPDSHSFRFIDGKIRAVHTISVLPGPQSDDNGVILRNPPRPAK